jgi:hypothetical protein
LVEAAAAVSADHLAVVSAVAVVASAVDLVAEDSLVVVLAVVGKFSFAFNI